MKPRSKSLWMTPAAFRSVFFAFHAVEAFFAGGGGGTALHQIFVGDRFGFDEAAFEIAVDDSGRFPICILCLPCGRGLCRGRRRWNRTSPNLRRRPFRL